MKLTIRSLVVTSGLALAPVASAQMVGLSGPNLLPHAPSWSATFGAAVPSVANRTFQTNYPYPGQCLADPLNAAAFPGLPACSASAGSFAAVGAACNQSAGPWIDCAAGAVRPFTPLLPQLPPTLAAAAAPAGFGTAVTEKYQYEVLNPPDYTPDPLTYTGADYYEIGLHEATGFQTLAVLGAFPNPLAPPATTTCTPAGGTAGACASHPFTAGVPDGMQWTGLRCENPAGCVCRSDFSAAFCPGGKIPFGAPLFTQIWGVGQKNMGGTLGVALANAATPWSPNSYIATWPSISIRGTRGRPVVVKWVNEFPNNHVFCPHPEAADWPCAIDRTFMGVRSTIDPATAPAGVVPDGVNAFGSPQQPDNSWVTHLHGGEIPPSTDGFAEKWFGNAVTGALYSPTPRYVSPAFENPSRIALMRPAGNSDTYTYPMVQEEALIWFHDHTLGKTHHNVVAGPAGFFPVKDPARHAPMTNGVCNAVTGQDCAYTWLDPLTIPTGAFGIPVYDLFLAIQDRSFSEDGSINFSNGLGQPVVLPVQGPIPGVNANGTVTPLACFPGGLCAARGTTPLTPGVNPQVHPVWVPEYFGDHALVNGVLWPKKQVGPGWYRIRLVDGSDSRCWNVGLSTTQPAAGTAPANNVPFYILANDQGYLPRPVLVPARRTITMCPGERYELLVNFGALPANVVAGVRTPATNVWVTNTAPAPFPVGITPQQANSPFVDLDTIMRFDLVTTAAAVGTCAASTAANPFGGFSWPVAAGATACIPNPAFIPGDAQFNALEAQLRPPVGTTGVALQNWVPPAQAGAPAPVVRMVYLNERLDGLTALPVGMQLNGVPFEYRVTETPRAGSVEVWKFINLTVDAHPMHPHLVKNLIVSRQNFSVPNYRMALCGSTTCQPGPAPGNEQIVLPDVTPFLSAAANGITAVTSASADGGFKDAVIARPNQVTTIVARWDGRWAAAAPPALPSAPGTAGAAACVPGTGVACGAAPFTYEPVSAGPYVWHCHINSHEDSEMMRTSLVVP